MKLAIVLLCSVIVSSVSGLRSLDPPGRGASPKDSSPFSLTQSQAKNYLLDIFKNSKEFASAVQEADSAHKQVNSGEAQKWFEQQIGPMKAAGVKGKFKEISMQLNLLSKIGNSPQHKCGQDAMFLAFDFINKAKTIGESPNGVQYAKSLAADLLERCAKEHDENLRKSRKGPFEVAMDRLFVSLSKLEEEERLLRSAGNFRFDSMSEQETICKVAIASKLVRDTDSEAAKFNSHMRTIQPVNCESHVQDFFQKTCKLDGPKGGLGILNAAIALGATPSHIASERYLKLNEYKRICRDYAKSEQIIVKEMKKVSQNGVDPTKVERLANGDDFDSPGDSAYFEDLRSGAIEGAQRHAMLLDEDQKSSGGLKFWRKWTE